MPNKGKILALDYGRSSVGMAVSDEDRQVVFGRGSIRNYGSLNNLFEKIRLFCETEKITEIVMGIPVDENGDETVQTEKIRAIAEKLEQYLRNIPISFEDESFTTFEANEFLAEKVNVKGSVRKQTEDEIAATIILKRYLDFDET
jgi:putative holliday junction resolvase